MLEKKSKLPKRYKEQNNNWSEQSGRDPSTRGEAWPTKDRENELDFYSPGGKCSGKQSNAWVQKTDLVKIAQEGFWKMLSISWALGET